MKRRHLKTARLIALAILGVLVIGQRMGLFRTFHPEETNLPQGPREPSRLIRVVDGDTIVVRWRHNEEHVRLLRINTPEQGQRGYGQSTDFLRSLLSGKAVALEFENPRSPERDVHGRLLAYVFANGQNASLEIVRAGWSRFWTRYGEGKYADAFRQAESEARTNKRGLWSERETLRTRQLPTRHLAVLLVPVRREARAPLRSGLP